MSLLWMAEEVSARDSEALHLFWKVIHKTVEKWCLGNIFGGKNLEIYLIDIFQIPHLSELYSTKSKN